MAFGGRAWRKTAWRRPALGAGPCSSREAFEWLAIGVLVAAGVVVVRWLLARAFAITLALGGCAPAVSCPLGSMPTRVSDKRESEASGKADITVDTRGGVASGAYKGSGSTEWTCVRLCPAGTALELREDGKARAIRCVDLLSNCPGHLQGKDGGP
jgi:hypothetical protein